MLGGGAPDRFPELAAKLNAAWAYQGRDGEPRTMALTYFAFGADPEGDAERSIGDYYSFAAEYAAAVVAGTAKGEDAVRDRVEQFRAPRRRGRDAPPPRRTPSRSTCSRTSPCRGQTLHNVKGLTPPSVHPCRHDGGGWPRPSS